MSGLTAAQKAAATPMRTSARKRDAYLFACGLRSATLGGAEGVNAWSLCPRRSSGKRTPEPQAPVSGGHRPLGARTGSPVRCGLSLPSRAQPGNGQLSLMWPGQICTGASSLVAWAGAASSAICLAAILGAILVVTAAASAADSLVLFVKSVGTKNRPNWLCWAKTRWSCDRGGEERGWGGRARGCPAARSGSTVGGGEMRRRGERSERC